MASGCALPDNSCGCSLTWPVAGDMRGRGEISVQDMGPTHGSMEPVVSEVAVPYA